MLIISKCAKVLFLRCIEETYIVYSFIGSTEPFEFKAESPKSKLHLTICCKSKTISIIEKARSIHGLALRAKEKVKENLGDNSDSSDSEDPEIITGLNIKQFATINNKSSLVRWIRADGKEKEVHLSFLEAKDRQRFEECLCVLQEGYDINTLVSILSFKNILSFINFILYFIV